MAVPVPILTGRNGCALSVAPEGSAKHRAVVARPSYQREDISFGAEKSIPKVCKWFKLF